jgi:hypothetical protein
MLQAVQDDGLQLEHCGWYVVHVMQLPETLRILGGRQLVQANLVH